MLVKVKTENDELLVNTDYITHVYEYHLDYKNESGINIWVDGSNHSILVPGMTLDQFQAMCQSTDIRVVADQLIKKLDKMDDVIMGGFKYVAKSIR